MRASAPIEAASNMRSEQKQIEKSRSPAALEN
jgi:hypothetical protein